MLDNDCIILAKEYHKINMPWYNDGISIKIYMLIGILIPSVQAVLKWCEIRPTSVENSLNSCKH